MLGLYGRKDIKVSLRLTGYINERLIRLEDIFLNIWIGLMVISLPFLIFIFVYGVIQFGVVSALFVLLVVAFFIAIVALIGTVIAMLFDIRLR